MTNDTELTVGVCVCASKGWRKQQERTGTLSLHSRVPVGFKRFLEREFQSSANISGFLERRLEECPSATKKHKSKASIAVSLICPSGRCMYASTCACLPLPACSLIITTTIHSNHHHHHHCHSLNSPPPLPSQSSSLAIQTCLYNGACARYPSSHTLSLCSQVCNSADILFWVFPSS